MKVNEEEVPMMASVTNESLCPPPNSYVKALAPSVILEVGPLEGNEGSMKS